LVGRFIKLGEESFVSPLDDRSLYDIRVAPADRLGAKDGEIVTVEITRPPIRGNQPPLGRITELLGSEDAPGIDIEIIIRKHQLPNQFPEEVTAEADTITEDIGEEQLLKREDLRKALTITIDGETARDFDDAVSLESLPNGRWQLGVHIADVSHYVREGTPLDEEAFRRGTSVYFPERAIPMLPERLSNGICSLKPNVDRLTVSAFVEIDRRGRVVDYRLVPSIIRSRERMTYTDVGEIIANPDGPTAHRYQHIMPMILEMHRLALSLIGRREERGAIDFEIPEAELQFNDEGHIAGIVRAERNIAHRLIEEFMLLANETVASHFESLNVPILYRVHEEPDLDKVEEFAEIAESFGHKFSMHGPVSQRGFQRLAREIRGQPHERMLSFLMLRSMQRARYTARNLSHYGLAMKTYTHFTSPIRRYPDLVVHRTLHEVIDNGGGTSFDLGRKKALRSISEPVLSQEREEELRRSLVLIGEQSSEREREADAAERELLDWRKTKFMAQHVGEQFDGIITSVASHGLYVELDDFFVEGLVHIATLIDDSYEFESRKHRLIGFRTGKEYRLGDPLQVLVDRVDLNRHLIDFSIVNQSDHPDSKRRKRESA
jgi:ribonuclease R